MKMFLSIKNVIAKTDFNVLSRLQSKLGRAQARITSFEFRTLMLCQCKKQMRECKPNMLKASSRERKLFAFKRNEYMKMFFLKWNVICNAEDRF